MCERRYGGSATLLSTLHRHPQASCCGRTRLAFACSPIYERPPPPFRKPSPCPNVPRTLRLLIPTGGKSITRRSISTGRLRGCRRLCRMLQSGLLPIYSLARGRPSLRHPPLRSRPQHHCKTVGPTIGRPRKPRLLLALRPKPPPLRPWRPQVRPTRRARVTRRF